MKKIHYTYKKSGVNIASADNFVKYISKASKKTLNNSTKINLSGNIGNFGSIIDISKLKIKKPVIVSSTDGVGTKIELANQINKFDTIGIDLVAMCVNDLIVSGAKPLFFLDYISISRFDNIKLKKIIKGIIKGCKISGCTLVGGETAEMPGTYTKNKFDIAGFATGIIEKRKLLVNSKIKKNDLVLAIPSSGIHSNGYSLIRYILKKNKININKKIFPFLGLKKELIKPTKIYVKEILKLNNKNLINGCAHITGGGLFDNLIRVIPNKLGITINLNNIKIKKIFKWIKRNNIKEEEMLKTFNCGIGFCIIVNKKNKNKVKKFFSKNYKPYEIGYISKNKKRINYYGKIKW